MQICFIGGTGHLGYVFDSAVEGVSLAGVAPGSPEEDVRSLYEQRIAPAGGKIFGDYRALLDDIQPDIAVVAPIYGLQGEIAVDCLQRGVHVFAEKPIAHTLEQLTRLRKAQSESGAHLAAMLPFRYDPAFRAAWLARGEIGEPLLISAQKSYKLGRRESFARSRSTYGGTLPWVGIHAVDWVQWFSGRGVRGVTARHTTRGNHDHGELESSGVCLFALDNGGSAIANIDFFRPAGAQTHGDDRVRVAGPAGVVEVRGAKATLITHRETRDLDLDPSDSADLLFSDFVGSIRGTAEPRMSLEELYEIIEISLLARESADTGTAQKLSPPRRPN